MSLSRRAFMKAGTHVTATSALLSTLPRAGFAGIGTRPEPTPPIQDPRLKELIHRALDAAQTAGALYADARLTHTFERGIGAGVSDSEEMVVGVRALVNGYWGFASSPVWSMDEMPRLGRESVYQAQCAARGGKERSVELAPNPVVPDGHWEMPVKIDPFEIWPTEFIDYFENLRMVAETIPGVSHVGLLADFEKQDKAFGATTGSYYTQRLYRTGGGYLGALTTPNGSDGVGVDTLSPAGMGWELFRDQPLLDLFREDCEVTRAYLALPSEHVTVGRFDAVFDALSIARLVGPTIGGATELDRVMGYEANAGGTSYITDPLTMRKRFKMGSPLLSVTANRTEPDGVATVCWDEEGVAPVSFTVVQDGILQDFQTTRESAGWIKESYVESGEGFRSHGCAYAPNALYAPLAHCGNLTMAPGIQTGGLSELFAHVENGLVFRGAFLDMDFQLANGYGTGGRAIVLQKGKPVARLRDAGVLFRTNELWNNCTAIGGKGSERRYGLSAAKGEPKRSGYYSVTAVPAAFKEVTVIDVTRKA